MKSKLLFIQALSPLQPGTGQGVGVIDLPIAREKATGLPYLPGSTIKGVFRDAWGTLDRKKLNVPEATNVFGESTDAVNAYAGSVTFFDARLLLLPVRSLAGVFAWVTSPLLLKRFARDAKFCGLGAGIPTVPNRVLDEEIILPNNSPLLIPSNPSQVILEDFKLTPADSWELGNAWADWFAEKLGNDMIREHFCIVSDDMMSYFSENATEVVARIRIDDESKTAAGQALWHEELLPVETVLSSIVQTMEIRDSSKKGSNEQSEQGSDSDNQESHGKVKAPSADIFKGLSEITKCSLQFGGGATIGRGLCKTILVP